MDIKYMKIIEEIMGEEARKRGFKITGHPKLIATKPLAYFTRNINDKNQSFEITEYLIGPKTLFLRTLNKEIHLKYNDENSYRNCIQTFQNYMISQGYDLLENDALIPIINTNNILFVKKNYEVLAKKFFDDENVIYERDIKRVVKRINEIIDYDWSDAIDELLSISGALTFLLLNCKEESELTESTTTNSFFIEYESKRHMRIDPIRLVYNSYIKKDPNKWIIEKLDN